MNERPPEKPTVELAKPPDWAIALSEKVATGFARQDDRLNNIERSVDIAVQDGKENNKRVTLLEVRFDELERRAATTSMRVKEPSSHDLEAKKALADEVDARKALADKVDALDAKTDAQTAMLTKLTDGASKLAANPIIRSIATMLGTAILTWLAAHGGHQ